MAVQVNSIRSGLGTNWLHNVGPRVNIVGLGRVGLATVLSYTVLLDPVWLARLRDGLGWLSQLISMAHGQATQLV